MSENQLRSVSTLSRNYLTRRLQESAFNSSHYMWLLAELNYFEARNGYIFAFANSGPITYVALEPLAPTNEDPLTGLQPALSEFEELVKPKVMVFIGVYTQCMEQLKQLGFHGLNVGKDPWVKLSESDPVGNKAKGIRSARNHAIKSGVVVEEWQLNDVKNHPTRKQQILDIHHAWAESSMLQLEGFLLATDLFAPLEGRRLFVALRDGKAEGLLLATPVRKDQSYYFEDLMFLPTAPNGATELLILSAMATLRKENAFEVSLGVVSLNNLSFYSDADRAVPSNRWFLSGVRRFAQFFYNSEGIELHRKRFQPYRWENVFIACRDTSGSHSLWTWLQVMFRAVGLFKPRFNVSPGQIIHLATDYVRKHQAALLWAAASLLLLWGNQVHRPPAIMACMLIGAMMVTYVRMQIRGAALFWTLVIGWGLTLVCGESAVERLFGVADFYQTFYVISRVPLLPLLFVGGLFVNHTHRLREPLLIGWSLLFIGAFSYASPHTAHASALFLPVMLFFAGYLAGKINFEIYRRQSSSHSREQSVGKTLSFSNATPSGKNGRSSGKLGAP
jgi:hypothetical protein